MEFVTSGPKDRTPGLPGSDKNYFNTGGVDFMKTNQVELKAAFGPRQAVGLHFVQGQADWAKEK